MNRQKRKRKDHSAFLCGLIGTLVMMPFAYKYIKLATIDHILFLPLVVILIYIYERDMKIIIKERSFEYTITNILINVTFAANIMYIIRMLIRFVYFTIIK